MSIPFAQRILSHKGFQIDKWAHYGPIYDRHLEPLWTTTKRVLEIGVDHGGSLQLWARAFPSAQIVGLDRNPACADIDYDDPRIKVVTGDQTDTALLASLGEFDVVIDDGSHEPGHQSISFTALYPQTRAIYLIEDIHHAHPSLITIDPKIEFRYPWVTVVERPQRIIRGIPSRAYRPDEQEARDKYGLPDPPPRTTSAT